MNRAARFARYDPTAVVAAPDRELLDWLRRQLDTFLESPAAREANPAFKAGRGRAGAAWR